MFAWRRSALRRRVLVNLKTDKAIAGVLWAKRGPVLVLKDSSLLDPTNSTDGGVRPVKLDGEVLIQRENVDFVQVFTAEG